MYSYGPPHMAVQRQDDQHEHTFRSYVRIRDVVQKTCLRRWTIGKSGERGSGISVLPARHDDDDKYCCYWWGFSVSRKTWIYLRYYYTNEIKIKQNVHLKIDMIKGDWEKNIVQLLYKLEPDAKKLTRKR